MIIYVYTLILMFFTFLLANLPGSLGYLERVAFPVRGCFPSLLVIPIIHNLFIHRSQTKTMCGIIPLVTQWVSGGSRQIKFHISFNISTQNDCGVVQMRKGQIQKGPHYIWNNASNINAPSKMIGSSVFFFVLDTAPKIFIGCLPIYDARIHEMLINSLFI